MPQTPTQLLRHTPLERVDARLLMQFVTGLSHAQLVTQGDTPLNDAQLAQWQALEAARHAGTPIAYLLGYKDFYQHRFRVSPAVLIPREDTELLVEAALSRIPTDARQQIADLGTGSGAIAISIAAARTNSQIWAVDISSDALAIAQYNAQQIGAPNVQFYVSHWFEAIASQSFDLIVSNPPYIDAQDPHLQQGDLRFEPQTALTDFADGLACLQHITQQAPAHLNPNGWLLLEHGYQQGTACRDLLAQAGFFHIQTLQDLAGHDRVSLGQWCKKNLPADN